MEHAEEGRQSLDEDDADDFTALRIATDDDLLDQIGKKRCFDLVDHEKVRQPASAGQARKRVPLREALIHWNTTTKFLDM